MGPFFNKKRLQNSVQRTTNSVTKPNLLPAASKSAAGRGSRQSSFEGGSGGNNSGMSRLLLPNFPSSQEERETQADHRPLCALNHSVYTETFKMETQRKVRKAVQLNDWAFSLDLTDAYLHIPIHHRSRKYLRFTFRGRVYQFKALLFGLSTSPFVLTRLMIVIATFLRRRAITLHPYLDDWLVRNQNRRKLLEHRQFIMSLINSLGLIINYEKSDLVPAQVFTFIGMEFLTHINIVRVPQARQMKILNSVRIFSQKTSVSARDFQSLLGQLNAAADFVMLGWLHLRPLQMSLHNQWQPQKFPLCHQIGITTKIL